MAFSMCHRDNYHLIRLVFLMMILAFVPGFAQAQTDSSGVVPFPVSRQVEVDFLSHYYEQDGNHSAVTGGTGTEELTDIGGLLDVLIPLDSGARLAISSSLNQYTSASTDNIDSYLSSASRKDSRVFLHLGYGKDLARSGWTAGAGGSFESDYLSTSLTADWYRQSPDKLTEFSLSGKVFLDTWLVIFPEELRAPGLASVPTNKRRSFGLAASFSTPLHPRWQIAGTFEPVLQQGLLSTPFHRVYFQNQLLPRIEKLPQWRLKLPGSVRLHVYVTDWLVSRVFYRFYWDSFGILGHTVSLEVPIKPVRGLSLYPFYRVHWQQGSKWFAPYGLHEPDALFYTSDFDLSGLYSQKYGMGISVAPLYGITRWRVRPERIGTLYQADLRYSRFMRSDGLRANSFSVVFQFRI